MKKILLRSLSILLIFGIFIQPIFADMGPKPSVEIEIKGLEEFEYFVTLLGKEKSTGPTQAFDVTKQSIYGQADERYNVLLKMSDYIDNDNFYLLEHVQNCTGINQFKWGYFPPQTFKVLIYVVELDQFFVSDIIERYAFKSTFEIEIDLINNEVIVNKAIDYKTIVVSFSARVLLTIIVEMLVTILFGLVLTKKWKIILGMNLITQIVLNVALNLFNYRNGAFSTLIIYFLLEILIVIIESIGYSCLIKDVEKSTLVTYTLLANILSFFVGALILSTLPIF